MTKLTLLLALASVMGGAMAGEAVVVKDTRQYVAYTASLEQDDGCTVALDPDHPKKGDCHEVRAKAPVGGEYVIRVGDWCQSDAFSPVESSSKLKGRPLPAIQTVRRTFRCDAQGKAI